MATIIKSIGSAVGRDFATVAAWLSSIPADVVSSGNSYIGELYNDSVFSGLINITGKTTSATNNITLRCAAGQSFHDHPNRSTNPLYYDSTKGVSFKAASGTVVTCTVPYTTIDGIQGDATYATYCSGAGIVVKNCIFNATTSAGSGSFSATFGGGATLLNSLLVVKNANSGIRTTSGGVVINSTVVHPLASGTAACYGILSEYGGGIVKNTAIFGFALTFNASAMSGGNNATDYTTAPGSANNLTSLVYSDQFIDANADFRLKSSSGLINKGVNLSATYGTMDVYNKLHGPTWDIGAWEYPEPGTAVVMSGPAGGFNNVASANFTVTLNGSVAADVVVTPNDGSGGGVFNPTTVTLNDNNISATFTYTPASVGDKKINATNNGGLTNPAELTYTSSKAATLMTLTAPTVSGRAGIQSADFTVSLDGMLAGTVRVIPNDNGAGGAFNPTFLLMDATSSTGTFKYIGSSGGSKTISITNDGGLAVSGDVSITLKPPIVPVPTPSTPTLLVKSIGAGKDYATLGDFLAFARSFDLAANGQSLMGEAYEDITTPAAGDFIPLNHNNTYYVILQPVPGADVNTLGKDDPLTYGTEGIELKVNNAWRTTYFSIIQNFRINVGNGGSLQIGSVGDNSGGGLRRSRIKTTGTGATYIGMYRLPGTITDCLFVQDAASTNSALVGGGIAKILRNTFVRMAGATAAPVGLDNSQSTLASNIFGNNVFINGGSTLILSSNLLKSANVFNNFTDNALTTPIPGVTVVTAGKLVIDTLANFRPDDTGVLIGAASEGAIDSVDIYYRSRGGSPDVGAAQGTNVNILPKVTVDSQSVNAQLLTISGTTKYAPTAGTLTLLPDATNPNGAIQYGPVPVTIGTDSFTAQIDNLRPGNYQIPVVKLSNSSGYNRSMTGGATFTVIGLNAGIIANEAPASQGNAPTLSIDSYSFDNATLSLSGPIDIQGDVNCKVDVYIDPAAGGVAIGPVKANIFNNRWAVQLSSIAPGNFKVRLVATANSMPAVTVNSDLYRVLKLNAAFTLAVPAST